MDPLDRLMKEVAQAIGDGPPRERLARQRRAVLRMSRESRSRTDPRWWWASALVGAMVVIFLLGRSALSDGSLQATVGEHPFAAGSSLQAARDPLVLEFSDRSRVALAPGTDTRLTRSDRSHVQLDLERGRLDLDVTPGGGRAWLVIAGPYSVEVTGTEFSVEWEPRTSMFSVNVTEGSVRVGGVGLGYEGTRLLAGQHLRIGGSPAEPPTKEAPPVGQDCDIPECLSGPQKTTPRRPRPTWHELAILGEHARALEAARIEGVDKLVERRDAAALDQLAHSARLIRDAEVADVALRALRRRFPRYARAHGVAFLLGRVALDLEHDPVTAAKWFETYLREQPNGELAEEARTRLMQIWDKGEYPEYARAAAQTYLRHHPEGTSAGLARRILGSL